MFYPLILRLGVQYTIKKFFKHHILKLLIIVNMFSFMSDTKYQNFVQNAFIRKELEMCKTFEGINKLAKHMDSDSIVLWVGLKKISGRLYTCDDGKCLEDIVTLQDAVVEDCNHPDGCQFREYKWLNIPSSKIVGFTLKCCVR